ncbi:MAG: TOMM precursor leader peptide-binding protein [Spirulina sp. SIO3F2]|nr:TOMM precursor leader peptide-binding protein [Spirulina sp. SIO3F2]
MAFQVQPHFHIEVVPPKQVYLLGERTNHVLTGQLYCQIIPFLDGHHTREQIAEKLNGEVPLDYIDFVLARLQEKGYLIETAPQLAPEVAAFWSELGITPSLAAQALQQPIRLHRVGDRIGDTTFTAMAAALQQAGLSICTDTADAGAAITVVLTDDYLHPDLAALNEQQLGSGHPWLLVKPLGCLLWIGPIFVPGETGCWHCLAQRLQGNRDVEMSVQRQKQKQQQEHQAASDDRVSRSNIYLPTSRAALPSTVQVGLQLAATETAKWLVAQQISPMDANGTPPSHHISTLVDKLITFDQTELEFKTHVFTQRPQCPTCGDPEILQRRGFKPLILESRRKQFTQDGGHRAFKPQQTVQKYEHLVSPVTGVVRELVRITDPSNNLVHTYKAGHAFGNATSLRGLRSTLKHTSSGKGKTDSQSRASGFCEAVERYSGIFQGDEPRKSATFDELGELAIHPERYLCVSDTQYANRETLNANLKRTLQEWIPQRFKTDETVKWTPIWSLTEQRYKYLPTAVCYYGYPLPKGHQFGRGDSNGNAAGNTIEEAILQGFMELVERDSVAIWWYNRLRRPAIDLTSFEDPYCAELQQFYAQNDRELWALDLTADLGIPAFVGVSRRTTGDAERLILGFGAHLDPAIAVLRALTEVSQVGLETDKVPNDELDGQNKAWLLEATLESQPYLAPDPTQPLKKANDYPQRWGEDIRDDVMTCTEIAKGAGLETFVLDQTRPDLGLNVVKVIVPGMRHFWPRFGSGRLYDVPVKLGWLDRPTPEAELNPTPALF